MNVLRVAVVDDQRELRDALADLIAAEETMELVGEASDAAGAIELARECQPQVILMDVRMPGGGGTVATTEIARISPSTRVVAFTAHDDTATMLEMLRAGAVGYLRKGASAEELLEGIRSAANGLGALSPEVSGEVVRELAGRLQEQHLQEQSQKDVADRVREALKDPEALRMVFQPIVGLRDQTLVGVEALARFSDGRGPQEWFADAALTGLTAELEVAAASRALEALKVLPDEIYVAVNLSPEAVLSDALPALLAGVPAGRVVVEITEHAPIEDYERLAEALGEQRSRGLRLAVDDAGAGFASLRHIIKLDPDIVKLDIDLTRHIARDRARRALATALISFAEEMGHQIVAEGVETQEELDALRALGVPFGQGYHLGRPGPLEDALHPSLPMAPGPGGSA